MDRNIETDTGPPLKRGTARNKIDTASELAEWIATGKLPELIPTRQERSLRRVLALIDAGRVLLSDNSLEDVSVEMLCQYAGTTVGAFYGRFENKHAFFLTLQRIQIIRSDAILEKIKTQSEDSTLEILCRDMVSLGVQRFRENLGVLKASLQHTREGMWAPFKAAGDRYRDALALKLAPHLRNLPPAKRDLRIRFAYQVMAGTLVHATLNNPGPLRLEDDALIEELARMVYEYLRAEL